VAVQELIRPWRRSCDDHSPAHLRRLGAAQVVDGRAALPLDACHREQLEWLAEEVSQAGGEATVWVGELPRLLRTMNSLPGWQRLSPPITAR